MPQTPSNSPLHQLWANHLQNHLSVTLGCPTSWPAEVHTLHGHTKFVTSVAYSADGSCIVSGSHDKTIRVWNPITGQCMAVLPQVHTGPITSVSYSPDGCYIVSGSTDRTIRVWDASTGQHLAGPFQGHTGIITSLAYSPDGAYIASASLDNTVRIWDADTGNSVAGPFLEHTDAVQSLAYSPDGGYIVSGSEDMTLGFGMSAQEPVSLAPSRVILSVSILLPIHQMAVMLSLVHGITPSGLGMQPLGSV